MDEIKFLINGKEHTVGNNVSSDLTLVDYIRNVAELRGTKYMCREGGCGACIVSAVKTPGAAPQAVNSCLVSVASCQGWEITTVEKVGNRLDGYNSIQTTLANNNGTQCGYCTPGWIMSMYSLMNSTKSLTPLEIEQSFGSNICRCTGYRPILDSFKKFATDSQKLRDIEDLQICRKNTQSCCGQNKKCGDEGWCMVSNEEITSTITQLTFSDGKKWFRVNYTNEIFSILEKEGTDSYMLLCGNTAKGVFPILELPNIIIDISTVEELRGYYLDQNLVINAGVTLSELADIWTLVSNEDEFTYLKKLVNHLDLVGHIPVKNLGSIGGNLMMKHQHNDFQSDIYLLLETVGAQLTIMESNGQKNLVTLQQFLRMDMTSKLILNATMPPYNSEYQLVSYKIMPRAQNSHAIVNAGFLYKVSKFSHKVLDARIVYGGLDPSFIRAIGLESYLLNRNLFTNETLEGAVACLNSEIEVTDNDLDPSAAYRKQLAINLFFKGLLELAPAGKLQNRFVSGATRIKEIRPASSARQAYDTDSNLWPLTQPIPKVEALVQCSGEAPYAEDLHALPQEVFANLVLATVGKGKIERIDPSKALASPGVIAFYSAKDIPGINSFTPPNAVYFPVSEEIFAADEVKYYNQPIGVIVAESRMIALRAAFLVEVTYSNTQKPVTDVREAKKDAARNTLFFTSASTNKGTDAIAKVIKGDTTINGQYHFTMETLVAVTKPTEEGIEIYPSTQWIDGVQEAAAKALNLDQNKVDVYVRRAGGGYGMKISRSLLTAVACSLVTHKLNRPCRMIPSISTNMTAVGKRLPANRTFEVQVNAKGEIQYLNIEVAQDHGFVANEPIGLFCEDSFFNVYDNARWDYNLYTTLTDTASNSWCRSPGTLDSIAMAEIMMDQIAYELSLDPIEVRLANINKTTYGDIIAMITDLKEKASYDERRTAVDKFNSENRWKKRGLRFSLQRWTPLGGQYLDTTISVFHGDGTVAITHGGIEIGQGINTKAAQLLAYLLKIPLEKVQVKAVTTMGSPNSFITGASLTSQNIFVAIKNACDELLARLEPIRNQMTNPTWLELVQKAFDSGVDLQAHGFVNATTQQTHDIYGVALAEVEVDVLTGEFEVIRVDLTQDCGRSISPGIDLGQVEGGFMMALGYWTSEELKYDKTTGELLTNRTWTYHVPQARDIPQDFRVYFREKSYSSDEFYGAKATGEASCCLAVAVPLAIREAIAQARLEAGIPTTEWFNIDGPYTVEAVYLATATEQKDFKFS